MTLLDLFRRPQLNDPAFGTLIYKHRAWNGAVEIPQYASSPIPLEISTPKSGDLAPFRDLLARHIDCSAKLKRLIAETAYDTYLMYVREDLAAGNFVEEDYAQYPSVKTTADVWRVLSPFRFKLTMSERDFDSILYLDVRWPNPHYFVAYCKNDDLYLLDVDG